MLFSPIKKVNTFVFKSSNFLGQCALVTSQKDTDMKDIIGYCKLSSVCCIFMDSGAEVNLGSKAKSKLLDLLTNHVSQSKISVSEYPGGDIVAVDAMQVVQKISKPVSVKMFKYLAGVFCQDVIKLMGSCRVVVIAFDSY